MKNYLVQSSVIAVACAMLVSCGGSDDSGSVEQTPTASAKPAEPQSQSQSQPQSQDNPPKGESKVENDAYAAIVMFKENDPSMKKFFEGSKGYAVFPKVAKGGLVVGGAGGKGVVYQRGDDTTIIGYSTLSQGSIGLQIGGQVFNEIIFFKTDAAFDSFKNGTTEFAGTASAVAADAGASADADYQDGVAVFTAGEKGLMVQASIGGQGFSFTPKQ